MSYAEQENATEHPSSDSAGSGVKILDVTLVLLVSTVLFGLGLCVFGLWPRYDHVLGLSMHSISRGDRVVILWLIWSVCFVSLLPALAIGALAGRVRGHRCAAGGWVMTASLISVGCLFDITVYSLFGLHIADLLGLANEPDVFTLSGDATGWVLQFVVQLSVLMIAGVVIFLGVRRVVRGLQKRAEYLVGVWSRLVLWVLVLGSLAVPLGWPYFLDDHLLIQRAWQSMPWEPLVGLPTQMNVALGDPRVQEIDRIVQVRFASLYPRLLSPIPVDDAAVFDTENARPNIVLIAQESLRYEALYGPNPLMPRLANWAKQGTRLLSHSAGTNMSERAIFSMLYSRTPFLYQSNVDHALMPQMLFTLKQSGYRTVYCPTWPYYWRDMEKFLGSPPFDSRVPPPDDVKGFVAQDRFAIATLKQQLENTDQPLFGMLFLHSSHFTYFFPDEYTHHTPILDVKGLHIQFSDQVTIEMRTPLMNRYRNSLAFLDDLIMDFMSTLDMQNTIVILSGDHGEAFAEHGRFGHVYALGEIPTQTPMVIVGKGVPAQDITQPTRHVDLLPTLIELINGRAPSIAHSTGRSVFVERDPNEPLVLANENQIVVVIGEERLAFDVDWEQGTLRVVGFQDIDGRPAQVPATVDPSRWAKAVIDELEVILR